MPRFSRKDEERGVDADGEREPRRQARDAPGDEGADRSAGHPRERLRHRQEDEREDTGGVWQRGEACDDLWDEAQGDEVRAEAEEEPAPARLLAVGDGQRETAETHEDPGGDVDGRLAGSEDGAASERERRLLSSRHQ
jgi:hypothetical protein